MTFSAVLIFLVCYSGRAFSLSSPNKFKIYYRRSAADRERPTLYFGSKFDRPLNIKRVQCQRSQDAEPPANATVEAEKGMEASTSTEALKTVDDIERFSVYNARESEVAGTVKEATPRSDFIRSLQTSLPPSLAVALPILALIVQNSGLTLLMRYSMLNSRQSGKYYAASTAVLFSEVFKLAISTVAFLAFDCRYSLRDFLRGLFSDSQSLTTILYLVTPCTLYILQNNLQYLAVSNLSAPVYQVLYQVKIVTAALFSIALLSKSITVRQWVSIVLLMLGVAIVQISQQSDAGVILCNTVGLIAVIAASLTSGLAGVLMEKFLKSTQTSLWLRNIQASVIGIVVSAIACYVKDRGALAAKGIFLGYNPLVWSVIALQAVGGLVVALIMKRSDNLVKSFATSISIILSCLVSSLMFRDVAMSAKFILGAGIVVISSILYGTGGTKSNLKDATR